LTTRDLWHCADGGAQILNYPSLPEFLFFDLWGTPVSPQCFCESLLDKRFCVETLRERADHATSGAVAGASERSIMNRTGIGASRGSSREGILFSENSAEKLGL